MNVDGTSRKEKSERIVREDVRVYEGEVIKEGDSEGCLREDAAAHAASSSNPTAANPSRSKTNPSVLGWARITIQHQGDVALGLAPVFEGAFSVNGRIHHIVTKDNYLRNRHLLDPLPLSGVEDSDVGVGGSDDHEGGVDDVDAGLVMWRDEDVMTPQEEAVAISRIGAAGFKLPPAYQVKPQTCGHDNLPYNTDPIQNPMLSNPFLGAARKRDDVDGGAMNTNFGDSIGNTNGCPTEQKIVSVPLPSSFTRLFTDFSLSLSSPLPLSLFFSYLASCTRTGLYGRCSRLQIRLPIRLKR